MIPPSDFNSFVLFHLSAFDLVNIHLFHDASNLVAWERSPSVYSETRQKALAFVLDRYDCQQTPRRTQTVGFSPEVDKHVG